MYVYYTGSILYKYGTAYASKTFNYTYKTHKLLHIWSGKVNVTILAYQCACALKLHNTLI